MRGRALALALAASVLLTLPSAAAADPPAVLDTWASAAGATAVDLNAAVDPGGAETRVVLEFLPEADHEDNLAAVPPRDGFFGAVLSPPGGVSVGSGDSPIAVARHIGGLRPATRYRYRFSATNPDGDAQGPSRLFTTRANSTPGFVLPDGRGWELVSPVDKNGGEIQAPGELFGGGVPQAAAAAGAIAYGSAFSFAGGDGAPGASAYLSSRDAGGWGTSNLTAPTEAGAFGLDAVGVPTQLSSTDLDRSLVVDPERCGAVPQCGRRYLLRSAAGVTLRASPRSADLGFSGADGELSHVVLSTCEALTPDAVEVAAGDGCAPGARNLYEWSDDGLELVNLLPGEEVGTPGAALAGSVGAVSEDGGRIYFTQGGGLYLRTPGATTAVDAAVGGGGAFQVSGAEGELAFFVESGHLYRWSAAGGAPVDLSPAGGVEGVLGASPDGAYAYFATAAGVFMSHDGAAVEVAASASPTGFVSGAGRARVSSAGNLLFLSEDALTEVDTGGFTQAFLYRPAVDELTCVSCNPTGSRPAGPSSIPGTVANGTLPGATKVYRPRALAADGMRVFFDSLDSLVAADTNADRDVYEWEASGVGDCTDAAGCVALISSGRAERGGLFLDASADGSDVFFLTDGSLVPTDPGAMDVYDARVGGGFPVPPPPLACEGDNCQVLPPEPDSPALGTAFVTDEGNPAPHYKKPRRRKKHRRRRKRHGHPAKSVGHERHRGPRR